MAIVQKQEETLIETLKEPPKYVKAIVGGIIAGVGAAATASVDGFTQPEIWGIAAVVVTTFGAVFGVSNRTT